MDKKTRYSKEELYNLLPGIYRKRDAEYGYPLRDLISLIAEQVMLIEKDIDNLYNSWFIETCPKWVVPYIGDLVGASNFGTGIDPFLNLRPLVANTVKYLQKKGTISALQGLCEDVTRWDTIVIEFFKFLAMTLNLNHIRSLNQFTANIRNAEEMDRINSAFDSTSHLVDIRRISQGRGLYNIQNIGVFLFRLMAIPVDNAPAFSYGDGKFGFSQIGLNIQLFNHPGTKRSLSVRDFEWDVSMPIYRDTFKSRKVQFYYLDETNKNSLKIVADGKIVDIRDIEVTDLTEWNNNTFPNKVAIDPELGRIMFPRETRPSQVFVDYFYGFSNKLGGGSYFRMQKEPIFSTDFQIYYIAKQGDSGEYESLNEALSKWYQHKGLAAVFEITDNEVYNESINLELPENGSVIIRAGQGKRPILIGNMCIRSPYGGDVTIDGLVIFDKLKTATGLISIEPDGMLDSLNVNHSTLIPISGSGILVKGDSDKLNVSVEKSIILGAILFEKSYASASLYDSIIDGKIIERVEDGRLKYRRDEFIALSCDRVEVIKNCTIIGKVSVTVLELATNSIFSDLLIVKRRDIGCVRYSFLPQTSETPNRYSCKPITASDPQSPEFTSDNYGEAAYMQLKVDCSEQLVDGADNGSEIGVFNDLFQFKRIKVLKNVLEKNYLKLYIEAGVFLVT